MPKKPVSLGNSSQWFVDRGDGKVYGPFTIDQFVSMVKKGHFDEFVNVKHPVFTDGKWQEPKRVRQVAGLFGDVNDITEKWELSTGGGDICGPLTLNDLQNMASQGKLRLEYSVRCEARFGADWIAVGRIPELLEIMQKTAIVSQSERASFATKDHLQSHSFSANIVLTLISSLSFMLVTVFWAVSGIGIIIAPITAIIAICELVTIATQSNRSHNENCDRYKSLGQFEVALGVLFCGNLVAIVCGILNIALLPAKQHASQ